MSSKYRKTRVLLACILFLFVLNIFSGCANLKEGCKKIWGSSITHLEKARPDAKTEDFYLSLDECFQKVQVILRDSGANVYLTDKDKKYLAAMNFKGSVDTTQAGIFFTKIQEGFTRVEVASMSPRLVDKVSRMIFSGLKNQ